MIIYGKNVFEQIREHPNLIECIYLQKGQASPMVESFIQSHPKIPVVYKDRRAMDELSANGVHQGIAVSIRKMPGITLKELISRSRDQGLILVLDHIQDPQNLGAILRSADASGVDGVILSKHESASLTSSAIKASTGAAFTVPICTVSSIANALEELKKNGFWIIGSDFVNARDYREGIYDVPVALVIGNEGKGMSKRVRDLCDYSVYLPMKGQVQSLNASAAATVLLYEINSQRNPVKK